MIANKSYQFDRKDLEQIDRQLQQIKNACKELSAFSRDRGGIAVLDRNLERITAPLRLLAGISEVLEIMKEQ